MAFAARWYRPTLDLIFPRVCALCNEAIATPHLESLCIGCSDRIAPTPFPCRRCSAPLTKLQFESGTKTCRYCDDKHWAFKKAYCYTTYSGASVRVSRYIKEASHEHLALFLGDRMANWLVEVHGINSDTYDLVVPIPQHWYRRFTNRYNQAEVLASRVARILDTRLNVRLLCKNRWTNKQGMKSISERVVNVEDSFAVTPKTKLTDMSILIVDDILTSGATAHNAAAALKAAGAKRVDVATFARGVSAMKRIVRAAENDPADKSNEHHLAEQPQS